MKTLMTFAAVALLATSAQAYCTGFGNMRTCTTNDGSNYTTQRFGNMSITNGYNAQTGNSWNSTTHNLGNMAITSGTAGNGNSWNSTTHNLGGGISSTYGTNSRGNGFNYTCNQFGCQ